MQTLLGETENESTSHEEPKNQTLRILVLLVLAILVIGAAYLYFNPWQTVPWWEVR